MVDAGRCGLQGLWTAAGGWRLASIDEVSRHGGMVNRVCLVEAGRCSLQGLWIDCGFCRFAEREPVVESWQLC